MLKSWTRFEKIWLFTAVGVITAIAVITTGIALEGDWSKLTWVDGISFISSITGIITVVLAAKGLIVSFYFGIVQAATYAYIAYQWQLYGESMLNAFFFLPIQFIGLWLWSRNRKAKAAQISGEDIVAKRLTKKNWMILTPVIIISVLVYAQILINISAKQPGLDSVAVVLSVFAQILLILRFAEQWLLWIVINVITIIVWALTLSESPATNDWVILAMWVAFLVNSIYGYLNWRKISTPGATQEAAIETEGK